MPFTFRVVSCAAIVFALGSISVVQAYAIPADPLRNIDYHSHDLNVRTRIIEETSTHIQTGSISRLNQHGSGSNQHGSGSNRDDYGANVQSGSDAHHDSGDDDHDSDGHDHDWDAHDNGSDEHASVSNKPNSDNAGKFDLLYQCFQRLNTNRDNIHTYASQASSSRNDPSFQQGCASELSSLHSNMASAQNILSDLGRDKGLANYNRHDKLEEALKDVVNLNKYTLDDLTRITKEIPGLGPILGPMVYDIKCILDEVLDTVENLTDGILNSLCPLLKGVIQDYSKSTCTSGSSEFLGFCSDLGLEALVEDLGFGPDGLGLGL